MNCLFLKEPKDTSEAKPRRRKIRADAGFSSVLALIPLKVADQLTPCPLKY